MPSHSAARLGMLGQRSHVRIVAGEPIRHPLTDCAMVFGMQDGGLFPVSPLQFQGDYLALPVSEAVRQFLCYPWPEPMPAHWALIGQRAELHLHYPLQVREALRLRR